MDSSVIILAGAAVLSLVVGLLTGLFGVGGGFLLTPFMIILLRVPPATAVGTGLVIILVTGTVGLIKRRGTGTVDLKLALIISIGSLIGVGGGQYLVRRLAGVPPLHVAGHTQNALEYVLMWVFLVFLAWIAGLLYYDYRRSHAGHTAKPHVPRLARTMLGPRLAFPSLDAPVSVPGLVVLGIAVGVLTGMLGVGGGVVWLPALFYLVGQRTAAAAGTSLAIVWVSCALGGSLSVLHGAVDGRLCALMLGGGMLGSWYGTHVGLRMAEARLKFYFIYVVLVAMGVVGARLVVMTVGR